MRVNIAVEERKELSNTIYINRTRVKPKPVYDFFKRLFDILFSGVALIVLSPVFFILAIIIKIGDKGDVLYSQNRIGKSGKTIKIYKFRSMKMNADSLENMLTPEEYALYKKEYKLDNDPRVTKVGSFLRKSSLDELPQLISILKGDMSIVGPRPVLPSELEENYTPFQIQVLNSVKQGLTGYWQAYARNNVGYENFERQKMELFYCRKRSFIFDIKIIFKTFLSVLKRNGAK